VCLIWTFRRPNTQQHRNAVNRNVPTINSSPSSSNVGRIQESVDDYLTMPPDADKLRQRKQQQHQPAAVVDPALDDQARETVENNNIEDRKCTLKGIKDTEVCINGTVYDLTGFQHPGGDSILLFGGNDVTVQYNMIHPYHTDRHLDKMRKTGTVVDYQDE
jgi:acyl-lipid (7-3)-desaturase (Delta-4 desaturase)